MSEVDRAIALEPVSPRLDERGLDVGLADMLVALITFACSLAVLGYGLSAIAQLPIFLLLHLAVLVIPATFWTIRACKGRELTFAVLLMIATCTSGPVGALGCAFLALILWHQRPSPARLQDWYDYIAGVVARSRLLRIYDELASGRLPSDPAAKVPRFRPILHGPSVDEQQRILAVMGRRYHPDFRPALRNALRNKNGFIRAQAAAVAARLDVEEKSRLWSTGTTHQDGQEHPDAAIGQGALAPGADALDAGPQRT
jgi:hypothetical protein